ncbi:MAG TPA: NB-ARC domain-containing protein [Micromonosporaceae bacterium]|nr:NB-ARC domain-containing protein [Micromonosporaceae bacterium]
MPVQLPVDVHGFAGRALQLDRLDASLAATADEPTAVLISAVSGTAGVGKTALAVRWAHHVRDRFPDGQLYLNLRGFDPGGRVLDPAEALSTFLDALGVPAEGMPVGLDALAGLYRSLVAGRRMLFLLDNARDADQVRPLLPGTATAAVVVTSRNQLVSLAAGAGAQAVTVDALSAAESRDLLGRRLGARVVAAEPAAVDRIITACAGLPLALTIAAARARQTRPSLTTLADELAAAGNCLDVLELLARTSHAAATGFDRHTPAI